VRASVLAPPSRRSISTACPGRAQCQASRRLSNTRVIRVKDLMRAVWLFPATAAYSVRRSRPGRSGRGRTLVWWDCRPAGSVWVDLAVIVVLTLLGAQAGTEAERHFARRPRHVVIDEVVGMLVTLVALPVSLTGPRWGSCCSGSDVIKRGRPRLEHLPGGTGIMADDIMAGSTRTALHRRRPLAGVGVPRMTTPAPRRPVAVAAILAVGSELLRHDRTDTNSLHITARLEELGMAWPRSDARRRTPHRRRRSRAPSRLVVFTGASGRLMTI
jgi:hypothetical protein